MSFWSALPIIGNIVDGVSAYFNKKMDVDLEKYKVKGKVDVKAIEADVAIIKARTELIAAMKDDPATKVGRIWIVIPTSVYVGVHMYYVTFANLLPKYLIWQPILLPGVLEYIPYAVLAYLLGTAYRGPRG